VTSVQVSSRLVHVPWHGDVLLVWSLMLRAAERWAKCSFPRRLEAPPVRHLQVSPLRCNTGLAEHPVHRQRGPDPRGSTPLRGEGASRRRSVSPL
jgi:hypothetical protein